MLRACKIPTFLQHPPSPGEQKVPEMQEKNYPWDQRKVPDVRLIKRGSHGRAEAGASWERHSCPLPRSQPSGASPASTDCASLPAKSSAHGFPS